MLPNAAQEVIISAGTFHLPRLFIVSVRMPSSHLWPSPIDIAVGLGQELCSNLNRSGDFRFSGVVNTPSYRFLTANPATASHYRIWELSIFPHDCVARSGEARELPSRLTGDHVHRREPPKSYQSYDNQHNNNVCKSPFSRDSITIRGASMAKSPSISLAWLDNSVDDQIAPDTFKRLREIVGDRGGEHNQGQPRTSARRGCTDGPAGSGLHSPKHYFDSTSCRHWCNETIGR
ncbi:uncharacterized protein PG998_006144 [Apiospora kogelbergensis]|uniref:HNH endonuclease n=1 Tax=Apiospora kogelbergensis TaxID=1337665 RepID=A0AAW0R4J9_9PEZI